MVETAAPADAVPADPSPAPPPLWRVTLGAVWPSFRRSARSILSLVALPLFLLSVVSLAKIFGDASLIDLGGRLKAAVEAQTDAVDQIVAAIAALGIAAPRWMIDLAPIYLSLGTTSARAERSTLLATEVDDETARGLWRDGFRSARVDLLYLAVPSAVRDVVLRLTWPAALLYRLRQPWVIEGPGPDGDEIATTVPGRELRTFVAMVSGAVPWSTQTVYDQRQILAWQAVFGVAAVAFAAWVSRFF